MTHSVWKSRAKKRGKKIIKTRNTLPTCQILCGFPACLAQVHFKAGKKKTAREERKEVGEKKKKKEITAESANTHPKPQHGPRSRAGEALQKHDRVDTTPHQCHRNVWAAAAASLYLWLGVDYSRIPFIYSDHFCLCLPFSPPSLSVCLTVNHDMSWQWPIGMQRI